MQVWFQQNSSRIVKLFLEQARGDSCGPSRWHGARGHCVGTVTPAVCLSAVVAAVVVHSHVASEIATRGGSHKDVSRPWVKYGSAVNSPSKIHFHVSRTKSHLWKRAPQMRVWCEHIAHHASRITHHVSVIVAYINRKSWTKKQVRIWTELWSNGAVCSYCRCSLAKPHFGLYWNNHKINFSLSFLKKNKKMNPIFCWLTGGFLPMTFISQRKPSGLLWERKKALLGNCSLWSSVNKTPGSS